MKKMSNTLTVKSMAEALTENKVKNGSKSKVYKELSDEHKGEQITQSVANKTISLKQAINAPRVDLSDTTQVHERTFMYLEACSISSCFPFVMGLSGALGCSRQNLNRWLLSHPGHPTTDFVNMAKDVMADILTNASLYNNANAVAVIFQLKNHFEHSDRVEISPVMQNQVDTNDYSAEEIRKRYMIGSAETKEDENGTN